MEITLSHLCQVSGYRPLTLTKILRKNYISNHLILNQNDLMKLYRNLETKNFKQLKLKIYLDDVLDIKAVQP